MRKLIAVITTLLTALAVLAFGLASPASANVTSPGNGAVLRGSATMAESGGYDDSTLDHCSWFGGSGGDTRLQLINSGGTAVINEFWNTGGSRSHTFDTRNYPNGSYTIRGTITIRKNGGFLGLGCSNTTETSNVAVTIDNITAVTVDAPSSAPQNTTIPVSGRLIDGNDSAALSGRTVTFSLSGGSSVNATTNSNGVASANLPVNGAPRNATVTASFAQTAYYKGSSATSPITITKNGSSTTLAQPAPVVFGQPTGFTATVARTDGTSTPGGTVQFTVNGANFGAPATVGGGGVAALAGIDSLPAGSHTIGAVYSGDANHVGSAAVTRTQVVNKAATTTTPEQHGLARRSAARGHVHRDRRCGRSGSRCARRRRAVQRRRPAVRHRGAAHRRHRRGDDHQPVRGQPRRVGDVQRQRELRQQHLATRSRTASTAPTPRSA